MLVLISVFADLVKHGVRPSRAGQNDDAICTAMIYFKHRWPGQAAFIEGPEEFRRRVWPIAEEVGLPLIRAVAVGAAGGGLEAWEVKKPKLLGL